MMATIVERKSDVGVRYLVMVRLKGHPVQCATFTRKTDAKLWAAQTEAAIRQGRHFQTIEARKHTLADLIDRYVAEGFQHKPKSLGKQSGQLAWWKAELGAYLLADVTPARIAECRSKLLAGATMRGRSRSPATVNRYLAALGDCLTDAVREYQWLDANPMSRVKKLSEPKGRTRFLSDTERAALLKASIEGEPWLHPLVLVAMTSGGRQGELLGLRWPDVDLQRGAVIFRDTKNGETRSVPVAGSALEALRSLAKVRRLDDDRVFLVTQSRADKAFKRALARSGIEGFRFHDLRHTAASYLAMSGATLAEIAEVLGHKTLAMVKRYSHMTDQHTAGIVGRMHERFFA